MTARRSSPIKEKPKPLSQDAECDICKIQVNRKTQQHRHQTPKNKAAIKPAPIIESQVKVEKNPKQSALGFVDALIFLGKPK